MNEINRVWPEDAAGSIPFWVYNDPGQRIAVFAREVVPNRRIDPP